MNNLLTTFKNYLLSLNLSPISRKLYLSDIRHFLTWIGNESDVISSVVERSTYLNYLDHLKSQTTAISMLKRTTASLKQFGTFVAATYSVPSPVANLTASDSLVSRSSDSPTHRDYIKPFTNYLNSEQLSPLTIKSYKSDITRYLDWVNKASPSSNMLELLDDKNIGKYLTHLSQIDTVGESTIDRKSKSLARFQAWYRSTYPSVPLSDNTVPALHSRSEDPTRHTRSEGLPHSGYVGITSPDVTPNIVKKHNSRKWPLSFLFQHSRSEGSPHSGSEILRNFVTLGILILFISTLSVFAYRQFSRDATLTAAYPSTPVTPNRQISFQGRLENAGGTPITSATNLTFKLFDAASAGTQLYSSGACSITPDSDGVFSTQIGSTCGAAIPATVFTENPNVYLEVTVVADVLSPRQQIATVAYALNSETIQGFPISATVSAIRNTVVPMNQWGQILVGEQNPRLTGVSGTFQISAPSLSLTTATGTNGNITLAPDGTGQVNVNGNTTSTNFFNVSDAQLTTGSLITGTAANNNTGFKLIDLLSGASPTSKFSVDNAGNTTIAGTTTLHGVTYTWPSADGTSSYVLQTNGAGALSWVAQTGGGGTNYWRSYLGSLSPLSDSYDLLLGNQATSSAKIGLININSGTPTATISAGTANNATYLKGTGFLGTENKQTLTLGEADTGNIVLAPGGTTALTAVGANLTAAGTLTLPNSNTLTGVANYLELSQGLSVGGGTTYHFDSSGNLVAAGITGANLTDSGLTPGSVVFAGTGGLLSQNNATFYFDGTHNRLGLGTNGTSMLATLDARATLGTLPTASISGNTALSTLVVDQSGVGDLFTASKSGATQFVIANNGNVGIGVANPTTKLEIGGGSSTISNDTGDITIAPASGFLSLTGALSLPNSNTLTGVSGYTQFSNGISVGGGTTYHFDSSGNLVAAGITGTSLTDSGISPGSVIFAGTGGLLSQDNANFYFDNANNRLGIGASGTGLLGTLDLRSTLGTLPVATISGATSLATLLVDQSGTGDLFTASKSGATKFVIANSGNVGIGTATPSSKLAIGGSTSTISNDAGDITIIPASGLLSLSGNNIGNLGNITVSSNAYFAGGTTYYVDPSGNAKFLDLIAADTGAPGLTVGNGSVGFAKIGSAMIGDNSTPYLAFDTNSDGTNEMVLTDTGRLGLGTNTPGKTLDVQGDINLTGKLYDSYVTGGIGLGDSTSTSLVGFGASSLVGALNELKNSNVGVSHNDYADWANQYLAKAEGTVNNPNLTPQGLFFDTFADTTKMDSANSTASGIIQISDPAAPSARAAAPFRVGLMGGQTMSTATTDNAGNTYLGSNIVNKTFYYDRTRDSSPLVQVQLGIDPNWYNGVTLAVATTSAQFSQNSVISSSSRNPNLSTTYNGSLIKATGNYASNAKTIYITIKSPTTFDWTDYNGQAATGVAITPGTAQALGTTGVSATFTNTAYNVGDTFRIASWFVEPSSSTRGSKQQFPERSYLIADNLGVDIVDADTQKLWMIFSSGPGSSYYMLSNSTNDAPVSTNALNGKLYIAKNGTSATGMYTLDFIHDAAFRINSVDSRISNLNIAQRNTAGSYVTINSTNLVTGYPNDVSAAVIPNQPTGQVTVSGWGYITGAAATAVSEVTLLPYTFNSPPTITFTANSGGPTIPANLSQCGQNTATDGMAFVITNSHFNAYITNSSGTNLTAGYYYCYTWTATGTVSPKQFVAVADGTNGAGGAADVINETDGTVAHLGSQATTWQTKVALAGNALYMANNNSSSNVTNVSVYYGIHGQSSEGSAFANRRGAYGIGGTSSSTGSMTNYPIILGSATGTGQVNSLFATPGTSTVDGKSNTLYVGTTSGLSVIQENQGSGNIADGAEENSGSVKYYTNNYVSEEMVGDIRGMWPLSANSALSLTDASIKADTLTNNGTVTAVSGVRGMAASFNGTNQYLSCTDAACGGTSKLDDGSNPWSVGAWIKPSATPSTYGIIISKFAFNSQYSYALYTTSTNTMKFIVSNNGSATTSVTSNSIAPNSVWTYVNGVYDGSNLKIYVNGVLENSVAYSSGIFDSTAPFGIGADFEGTSTTPANYFPGSIDEPFVTATALSAGQIKHMYEVGARALQSHATTLGGGAADKNQQLAGSATPNAVVLDAKPDYNNQFMYVSSSEGGLNLGGGGVSKIQLNGDTNLQTYTTSSTPTTLDSKISSLAVGYNLEAMSSTVSGALAPGYDSHASATTGSLFSKTQTLNSATKFTYLWTSFVTDSSDASNGINVYACNAYTTKALCDSNSAWVLGTTVTTDSTQTPPEREYSFAFPTAGSNLTVKVDLKRGSTKTNTYLTRYGVTWASSVGGADIAERYQSTEPVYPGDILTIAAPPDGAGTAAVSLSRTAYDAKLIGVVTTNPGIVMDNNLVDLNFNAASRNSPDRPAVALAGRIPVNVSTKNGAIGVGDPITSSSIPGVGVKAMLPGEIVAKALASFDCTSPGAVPQPDGTCRGQVLALTNVSYFDPGVYLTDTGDFIFSAIHDTITASSSSPVSTSSAIASSTIHDPQSTIFQLVHVLQNGATELVDRIGTFGSLIAASIRGQTLQIDTISPLASGSAITITGPVQIKSNLANSANMANTPALTVDGEIDAATISARVAELDKINAGNITAQNIVADTITANHIEGLDAQIASISGNLSDSQLTTITDRIKARLAALTGNTPTAADLPTPQEATASQIPSEAVGGVGQTATASATLASASLDFATINNYLAVIGSATITTLDVTSTLNVNTIQSKSNLLALQPLGGTINLAGGTLIVDSTGQVAINGDLAVKGKILAQSAEFNTIELGTPPLASGAGTSALGQLLSVYNEAGQAVATIDASGSANLATLTTQMITIAAANEASSSATPSGLLSTAATSNSTAGNSVLVSPNTELTINTSYDTSHTLVYLTPTGNTDNKVLFVKSKSGKSFTVGIDSPASSDISFNWWIIQLK